MSHRGREEFSVGVWDWAALAAVCAGLIVWLVHRAHGLDDVVLGYMAAGMIGTTIVGLLAKWVLWRLSDADRWAGIAACACAGACVAAGVGVVYMQGQNERVMKEAAAVVRALNRDFAVNLGNPRFIGSGQAHRDVLEARTQLAVLQRAYAHTEAASAVAAMSGVMETMARTDLDFIGAQARVIDLAVNANLRSRNRDELIIGWRRQLETDRITIANYGKRLMGLSADCRLKTRGLPLDDETVAAMCDSYTQHLDKRIPLVRELVDAELDVIDRFDDLLVFVQAPANAWLWRPQGPADEREFSAARALTDKSALYKDAMDRFNNALLRVSMLAMVIPEEARG